MTEQSDPIDPDRADLLAHLAVFSQLAYPEMDVAEVIGTGKLRESKFLQEVQEEGAVPARQG